VVMNSDFYCKKSFEMVSDEEFYKTTTENADEKTRKMIDELVNKDKNGLLEQEKDYLHNLSKFFVWITKRT